MNETTLVSKNLFGLAMFSLAASNVYAVGLQVTPGTAAFGTAGAGQAAHAGDAMASWSNPANMTQLEGNQGAVGVVAAETDINFEAEQPKVGPAKKDGGDAGGVVHIPSAAYVHSVSDDLKVGVSLMVPYGNSIDYADDWAGANVAKSASMETIQVQPSVAYRVTDSLSLGAGINANYIKAEQELTVMGQDLGLDADDVAYGWTAGATWDLNQSNRLGLVYRSEVNADLEGDGSLNGTSDYASLNWDNPATVMLSGYHQVSDNSAFVWDVGRVFYSSFETTTIYSELLGMELDIDRHWQDANRYAVGWEYALNSDWTLQTGFSLDESPVDDQHRSADMPLDEIKRYTVGALYKASPEVDVAFGLEYADLGTPSVAHESGLLASPAGEYNNSAVAGAVSMNYKF